MSEDKELLKSKDDEESLELMDDRELSKPENNKESSEFADTLVGRAMTKQNYFFAKFYNNCIRLCQGFLAYLKSKLKRKPKVSDSAKRMSKLMNKLKSESKGQLSIKHISVLLDGLKGELKILNSSETLCKIVDKMKSLTNKVENSNDPNEIQMLFYLAGAINSVESIEKKKELLNVVAEFISHIEDNNVKNKYLDCVKFFKDFLGDVEELSTDNKNNPQSGTNNEDNCNSETNNDKNNQNNEIKKAYLESYTENRKDSINF
jgi:hypothetical protein